MLFRSHVVEQVSGETGLIEHAAIDRVPAGEVPPGHTQGCKTVVSAPGATPP